MNVDELKSYLESEIVKHVEGSSLNYVSMRAALTPSASGLKMFEAPLIAIGSADDALFAEEPQNGMPASPMRLPSSWLANATSVISYFVPMTELVRKSNYEGPTVSAEWLHACDEGKLFMLKLGEQVERVVRAAGYEAVCPACHPEIEESQGADYVKKHHSAWSEDRAAYICGLGTYSLSGGIITEAGVAGRLGSVVVSAPLPVTERPYTSIDEYCTKCGACIERCPVGALSLDAAKDYRACHAKIVEGDPLFPGYYGCGKCRVDVPCETQRP